jgi:hypothetical protein
VWLLATDHFSTGFRYKFEDARAQVSRTLGSSKLSGDATFYWNTDGGNALGTLLVYARAAADWTLRLSSTNREVTERLPVDLPHFVKDPVRRFPFRHYELWADSHASQLNDYAEQFNLIVSQLERSRLAEIRNGLDHFREEDRFLSADSIIACERRLSDAIDTADLKRFIPKAFWLMETTRDEFGLEEYVLQDYNGRKLVLNGPAIVSGVLNRNKAQTWVVPYGNLLGYANSEVMLQLTEVSEYSKIWTDYPIRRKYRADAVVLQDSSESPVSAGELQSSDSGELQSGD